jgi:hypothetical protein
VGTLLLGPRRALSSAFHLSHDRRRHSVCRASLSSTTLRRCAGSSQSARRLGFRQVETGDVAPRSTC